MGRSGLFWAVALLAAGLLTSCAMRGADSGRSLRAGRQRHVRLAQRPLRVVLLAAPKDHGPGEHDYPLWQERWALLLGGRTASAAGQGNLCGASVPDGLPAEGAPGVTVERATGWPSDAQFAAADVIAAFCYLPWTAARKKQVAAYLARGGGLALIHSATWTRPKADPEVAALTGVGGFTRYRHGVVRVELAAPDHPLCRGLPKSFVLNDEPYWPPTPTLDASKVTVLAVSREQDEDGTDKPQPLFWAHAAGRGRVFGCVPGHYSRTFDDPLFRLWLLRGIAWAAGEDPSRFDGLAARGSPPSGEALAETASAGTVPGGANRPDPSGQPVGQGVLPAHPAGAGGQGLQRHTATQSGRPGGRAGAGGAHPRGD